ncbi:hypothetical protein [Polyangium sp. y55x31]|uniref:hypothetical protein n=1 Tax=Polyangium sp. y55x31 TaxID=3042688 RepID=UPI0024829C59|nr:hypothetical protein [Polyangium sp. y55x31]MDI1475484.1 hypothetical protein [Polyangium sp. y55x31]
MRAFLAAALFLAGFSLSCASADDGSLRPEPRAETPRARSSLPPEFAQLGARCPVDYQRHAEGASIWCGKDGRIGVVTVPERTTLPEGAQRLVGSEGSVLVLIERERVWVQYTCVGCRHFTDMTSVVLFAYATDDQLMQLQEDAELADKSPLRDAESWLAAVMAWQPRK